MSIVAAGVVPHSPLLLSSVAKGHAEASQETIAAVRALGQEIYARQPDAVIMITPHGDYLENTITVEVADQLTGDMKEFGDLLTEVRAAGATALAHQLKEAAEDVGLPLHLQTHPNLDYSVTVPLLCLWPQGISFPILPVIVGPSSTTTLVRLGHLLQDFCQSSRQRIALLASGDTSRRRASTGSSLARPTEDERRLSLAITKVHLPELEQVSSKAAICLRPPLVSLLSALEGLNVTGAIRSFSVPLGVGQLVASFEFGL